MKTIIFFLVLSILSACSSSSPGEVEENGTEKIEIVNEASGEIGNGGDPCENRIQIIRDDIKNWIQNGGFKNLSLPKNVLLEDYKKKMLQNIKESSINCIDEILKIDSVEKTCLNTIIGSKKTITCNLSRFSKVTFEDQYKLVHHEYAGLSGLENNHGTWESNYRISSQLSQFLEEVTIKRLSILPLNKKGDTFLRHILFVGDNYKTVAPFRIYDMRDLLFVFSEYVDLCYVPGESEKACNYLNHVIQERRFDAYGGCHLHQEKLLADVGWSYGNGSEVEYSISIPACKN